MNRRHFLLAALACACAAPVWAAPNLDDLKAAGGLRVAVYRDFPPYSWQEAGEIAASTPIWRAPLAVSWG